MEMQYQSNSAQKAADGAVVELTERQLECLAWAEQGKSARDIGQIVGISGRTVEGHLAKACDALGVRTRIQAVVRARSLGLLSVEWGRRPAPARSFAAERD